jgi:hypothetical protein
MATSNQCNKREKLAKQDRKAKTTKKVVDSDIK